jgi:RHS repeat-associated protein
LDAGGREHPTDSKDRTNTGSGSATVFTPPMIPPGTVGLRHELAYNPEVVALVGAGTGNRWMPVDFATLVEDPGTGEIVCVDGKCQLHFKPTGGDGYEGLYGAEINRTLEHQPDEGKFWLGQRVGSGLQQMEFHDFAQASERAGKLAAVIDRSGRRTEVTLYGPYGIREMQKEVAPGEFYKLDYEYGGGPLAGNLQYVTLRKKNGAQWTPIRRTEYLYYDGAEPHGAINDLKAAKEQQWDGTAWSNTAITYMRYYKEGEVGGKAHDLKYVVEPQAYAQLVHAGADPLTNPLVDKVPEYATLAYDWNGTGQVAKNTIRGLGDATGAAGQTWERVPILRPPEKLPYNVWSKKLKIHQADGNTRLMYVNWLGLPMLEVLIESGSSPQRKWCTYYRYDSNGQVILSAQPSAVISYDEALPDLVGRQPDGSYLHLREDAGLIQATSYYASTTATTATPGGVRGYLAYTAVKEGYAGPEIKQRALRYIASDNSHNGKTVYLIAEEDAFPDNGVDAVTTSYEYFWYTDTAPYRIQQKKTIVPEVPESQNGAPPPSEPIFRMSYYDKNGNETWTMCELGMVTKYEYDEARGLLEKKTVDVGSTAGLPDGWTLKPWTHQDIVTEYSYDAEGRLILTLGPAYEAVVDGSAETVRGTEWRVYQESPAGNQIWTGQGYVRSEVPEDVLVDPVEIMLSLKNGMVTDRITSARSTGSGALSATDTFHRRDWKSWTHADYDADGLKIAERVYDTIPYSCSGLEGVGENTGESGVNYDETSYGYDLNTNRLLRTVTPGGTITRTVYDQIVRAVGSWVGTHDVPEGESSWRDWSPTNLAGTDMVQVTANEYDDGDDGGDSNVTTLTQFVDGTTARVTTYAYDFRDRRVTTDGAVDYFQKLTYDNLSRVVMTEQYNEYEAPGRLVARSETHYDNRNRVYRTEEYAVDPSTGDPGNVLTGNNWYDAVGHLIRTSAPGSGSIDEGDAYTCYGYDTVGRRIRTLLAYGGVPGAVVEKQKVVLDKASHVLYTVSSMRNTDASTLSDSYQANWYDGAGRMIARANYGLLPPSPPFERPGTVPARSDTVLVETMEYDAAGRVYKTQDPKAIEARTAYDDAGRLVRKIDNYVAAPEPGDLSANRTTETTYNADGKVETVTLKMATLADDQTTIYTYGTTLADSDIASTLLLRSVQYADSSGAGDRIEFKYNRQGQVKERKDQLDTVHEYAFDGLGRATRDTVTALGSGVDGRVRRIDTSYEVRGLVSKLTSYSGVAGTVVVNEVKLEYNDFRQLVTDYQSHGGAVNPSTTLKVQYAFADGSANKVRPETLTYPNGREIDFGYGTADGMDDHLNRLQAIREDGDALATYQYLGLSRVVRVDLPEPEVRFDLWGGSPGVYAGLDRFLRPIDVQWLQFGGGSSVLVQLGHGYDPDSNRLYRKNMVAADAGKKYDQLYAYDNLNRLQDMQRGLWGAGHTPPWTKAFEQQWNLDKAGNWSGFNQDNTGSGTWSLEQARVTNKGNEIVEIAAAVGPEWETPAFDAVGNMRFFPKPEAPEEGFTGVYDAWNRLVKVKDGSSLIVEYAYDGRNYRLVKETYEDGSQVAEYHFYYTSRWQLIEERLASPNPDDVRKQYVWGIGINELILRDRDTGGTSELDERLYALQDTHYDVTCLVDKDGQPVERYEYEAYGKPQVLEADFDPRTTSDYDWEVLYSGYLLDSETALYYVRYRYYHATLGQWITRDPLFDNWGGHMLGDGAGVAKNNYGPGYDSPVMIRPIAFVIGADVASRPSVDLREIIRKARYERNARFYQFVNCNPPLAHDPLGLDPVNVDGHCTTAEWEKITGALKSECAKIKSKAFARCCMSSGAQKAAQEVAKRCDTNTFEIRCVHEDDDIFKYECEPGTIANAGTPGTRVNICPLYFKHEYPCTMMHELLHNAGLPHGEDQYEAVECCRASTPDKI